MAAPSTAPSPPEAHPSFRRQWQDLPRWLIIVPVVLVLLFGCSHLALLAAPPVPNVDTRSKLRADYAAWSPATIPAISAAIVTEIVRDQATSGGKGEILPPITVTSFWSTATPTGGANPSPVSETPSGPTMTATLASTSTRTLTPTVTRTLTPTFTRTSTATATRTRTPAPAITFTLVPPPTFTSVPPTAPPQPTSPPPATATRTRTPTSTATSSRTPTPTATPSQTPTITNTATDTSTPTHTATPTHTPTPTDTPSHTPTPTETPPPTVTPTNPPEPNVGGPNGTYVSLGCSGSVSVYLGSTPLIIPHGVGVYDLVDYENPSAPGILLDWVMVEVGLTSSGPWFTVFNWGDGVIDANTNIGALGYSPGEPNNEPIPSSDLWGGTGIAIDVDAVAPAGTYWWVRASAPPGCLEPAEVDAIEVLP